MQCVAACCRRPPYSRKFRCVAVFRSVLQCVAVCCSVLQCVAVCCSVSQYFEVCCSLLQTASSSCVLMALLIRENEVYCSMLQCVAMCTAVCCSVLQCITMYGSELQYDVVWCSVLQCVADGIKYARLEGSLDHKKRSVLQGVAGCCSVLQRVVVSLYHWVMLHTWMRHETHVKKICLTHAFIKITHFSGDNEFIFLEINWSTLGWTNPHSDFSWMWISSSQENLIHYLRENDIIISGKMSHFYECGSDEMIHILIFREIIRHDPCEWVMSRTRTSHVTCEWVMSRTWTSHVTCEWVMSHTWTSHITCEWVTSHIWMRHVTREWVTTHMNHDPRDMAYFPSYFFLR